jgi:hypothetical protein
MSHSPLEFDQTEPRDGLDIAIVGMAARFPGAPDLEASGAISAPGWSRCRG